MKLEKLTQPIYFRDQNVNREFPAVLRYVNVNISFLLCIQFPEHRHDG